MGRIERKLFQIQDELQQLDQQEQQVEEELSYHRHLLDDAERDALVAGSRMAWLDRDQTAADVSRFESLLDKLSQRRAHLEKKRQDLLGKLVD